MIYVYIYKKNMQIIRPNQKILNSIEENLVSLPLGNIYNSLIGSFYDDFKFWSWEETSLQVKELKDDFLPQVQSDDNIHNIHNVYGNIWKFIYIIIHISKSNTLYTHIWIIIL